MGAGYINTILCSTVLVPNNICGIGGLTHCFNRFKSGLTHCLINLFPSVLGGYTSFLLYFVLVMLPDSEIGSLLSVTDV